MPVIKPVGDKEVNMFDQYYPMVVPALAGENYTVYAYFTDGTIHLYDMKLLIEKGGVFARLRNEHFFTESLTVLNSTVAWVLSGHFDPADCIDIDPFELYEAEVVEDPLSEAV